MTLTKNVRLNVIEQANDEDVDRDGPGGEDGDPNDNDEGEANCWGKVTSGLAHNNDGKPGIGEHSSDPVPNDGDNETPREGVGNQREGHHQITLIPQVDQLILIRIAQTNLNFIQPNPFSFFTFFDYRLYRC